LNIKYCIKDKVSLLVIMFRNIVMFPSRFGQPLFGVEQTPQIMRFLLDAKNIYHPIQTKERLDTNLFNLYNKLNTIRSRKLIIGGDHSMSIATVADSLNRNPKTKVLWIDAHADINTPESSISKNIHGMPLSFLTGLSCQKQLLMYTFIKNKLDFRNLMYIGLRDMDVFEKNILEEKNVDVITVDELENDFNNSLLKIKNFISDSDIHISFDVDCLDPGVFPCTGTKVSGGITLQTAKHLMDNLNSYPILNMDLTEINLNLGDKDDKIKSLHNLFYILDKYIN